MAYLDKPLNEVDEALAHALVLTSRENIERGIELGVFNESVVRRAGSLLRQQLVIVDAYLEEVAQ